MKRGWATIGLATACGSCTPAPAPVTHWTMRIPASVAATDRDLLRRLALADPAVTTPLLPEAKQPTVAPAFSLGAASGDDAARAADCLTAAVYYEARSEPIDGQRAVAQVVLNRVRDPAFPASVCRVVYQRTAHVCQFTFACDGSMNHPIQPRAWAIAGAVARAALSGLVFAPVGAATHYHANYVLPWWASSLTRIGAIGNHIFYRWQDRLSGALAFRQTYAGHEAAAEDWTVASSTAGASIEAGDSVVSGVTIHRGNAVAVHAEAAAGPPPPLAQSVSFGVRVHRGDADGEAVSDDAPPTP